MKLQYLEDVYFGFYLTVNKSKTNSTENLFLKNE